MVHVNRPFGPLNNSYGVQMTAPMRAYLRLKFSKVAREMTEITNHAWGLFFQYLLVAGDDICATANPPPGDPPTTFIDVHNAMIFNELNLWTSYNSGVYMVNKFFVDLLRLGHDVVSSITLLA